MGKKLVEECQGQSEEKLRVVVLLELAEQWLELEVGEVLVVEEVCGGDSQTQVFCL